MEGPEDTHLWRSVTAICMHGGYLFFYEDEQIA